MITNGFKITINVIPLKYIFPPFLILPMSHPNLLPYTWPPLLDLHCNIHTNE